MIINRLIVKNWRNFQHINVPLRERQFIVGPNASGKSNLLDIFRFLRDIAKAELEQTAANAKFREIGRFLRNINYLHLVRQLIRFRDAIQGKVIEDDPLGQAFLERVASVHPSTRRARLKRIERALKIAVPQFEDLAFIRDKRTGHPHLQARYSHWCSNKQEQHEDQFSDGVLRLIGLLWSLFENDSIVLYRGTGTLFKHRHCLSTCTFHFSPTKKARIPGIR